MVARRPAPNGSICSHPTTSCCVHGQRDASSAEELIQTLFNGPNDAERDAQFSTAIPDGLRLLSARVQGSVLYLDITDELSTLSGPGLVQALAQIVYTASELDGVQSVQLLVDNHVTGWPRANLESTNGTLRTYDYPGMVRTAQPAFPAVPSGV